MTDADLVSTVRAAIAAPSVHNSQPWQFRIHDGEVDVFADWRRKLDVIDPSGRELFISIGAALFNLRITMQQQDRVPITRLLPDPAHADLVARVIPGRVATAGPWVDGLAAAIPKRHTNRRPFGRVVIPAAVLGNLIAEARREGATLRIADAAARSAILALVRTAEQRLRANGRYRAEIEEWTAPVPGRRDGIPAQAFGAWDAMEALPMRDFGLTQSQLRRRSEPFEPYPTIAVLCTDGDTIEQWLQCGQALQRVLLAATVHGLAATPMSQPLEIPELRRRVSATAADRYAQVILRLGYGEPTGATPRRRLTDVLLA